MLNVYTSTYIHVHFRLHISCFLTLHAFRRFHAALETIASAHTCNPPSLAVDKKT